MSQCNAWRIRAAFPFFFSCVQCFCVFILPVVKPTLLRQMDMEYFNACVRVAHERGSGTNNSAQGLTEGLKKTHYSSACPIRGSNPGSSEMNSELRTSPFPSLSSFKAQLIIFDDSSCDQAAVFLCQTLGLTSSRENRDLCTPLNFCCVSL